MEDKTSLEQETLSDPSDPIDPSDLSDPIDPSDLSDQTQCYNSTKMSKANSSSKSKAVDDTATRYANKPLITAFISEFETFLKANNLPNMRSLSDVTSIDDYEYVSNIYDNCSEYINKYIKEQLSDTNARRDIIKEYGFKKLIDLMCSFNGDEICELELFDIDENMSSWLHMLLMSIANLYD